MGLDISIEAYEPIKCPHCEETVAAKKVNGVDSCGWDWYKFLEPIGYYVPYEKRTPENDWYGKDMTLTEEQCRTLIDFVTAEHVYNCGAINFLVSCALRDGNKVVINADW